MRGDLAAPADRPAGLPGNARFAAAGLAFGIIFIVTDIIAVIAGNDMSVYGDLATDTAVPLIVAVVLTIWLLNRGRLGLIKFCRWLAVAVTVAYVAAIVIDAARVALYPLDAVLLSGVAGVLLAVFSPLQVLMWRDFRRCRWLDPRALPHEWELAAIRDPNSVNYRPPKGSK